MDTIELDKELLDLQNKLLRFANDGTEYSRVANRIYELRDERQDGLNITPNDIASVSG